MRQQLKKVQTENTGLNEQLTSLNKIHRAEVEGITTAWRADAEASTSALHTQQAGFQLALTAVSMNANRMLEAGQHTALQRTKQTIATLSAAAEEAIQDARDETASAVASARWHHAVSVQAQRSAQETQEWAHHEVWAAQSAAQCRLREGLHALLAYDEELRRREDAMEEDLCRRKDAMEDAAEEEVEAREAEAKARAMAVAESRAMEVAEQMEVRLADAINEAEAVLADMQKTSDSEVLALRKEVEYLRNCASNLRRENRILQKRIIRRSGTTATQNALHARDDAEPQKALLVKKGGVIPHSTRALVRHLVDLGLKVSQIPGAISAVADSMGISVEGSISDRSVGRIMKESLICSQIMTAEAIHNADSEHIVLFTTTFERLTLAIKLHVCRSHDQR